MEEEALIQRVLHLRQVEKLSQRQIAAELKGLRSCSGEKVNP
jgi:hypothetical protein